MNKIQTPVPVVLSLACLSSVNNLKNDASKFYKNDCGFIPFLSQIIISDLNIFMQINKVLKFQQNLFFFLYNALYDFLLKDFTQVPKLVVKNLKLHQVMLSIIFSCTEQEINVILLHERKRARTCQKDGFSHCPTLCRSKHQYSGG